MADEPIQTEEEERSAGNVAKSDEKDLEPTTEENESTNDEDKKVPALGVSPNQPSPPQVESISSNNPTDLNVSNHAYRNESADLSSSNHSRGRNERTKKVRLYPPENKPGAVRVGAREATPSEEFRVARKAARASSKELRSSGSGNSRPGAREATPSEEFKVTRKAVRASSRESLNSKLSSANSGSSLPGVREATPSEGVRVARKAARASSRDAFNSNLTTIGFVEGDASEELRVARKAKRGSAEDSAVGIVEERASDNDRVTRKVAQGMVVGPPRTATTGFVQGDSKELQVPEKVARATSGGPGNAAPPIPSPYQEATAPGARDVDMEPIYEQQHDGEAPRPGMPREISATLVTDKDVQFTEDRKNRVRREAEAEVERRIMSNAVYGEATIVPQDEIEEEENTAIRRRCIMICILFLIIIITLAVVLTRSDNEAPKLLPINSVCKKAFGPLTNLTRGSIEGVIRDFGESDVIGCQVEEDDAFGLWYYLEGDGGHLSASTCNTSNLDAQMDTQVLVFSGSCESLTCIGGSDELCGSHGTVGWLAEEGQRYFVLVRGFRKSLGQFSLIVDQLTNNENCEAAETIDTIDSQVFGSTRNHKLEESFATCDGSPSVSSGAWYQIQGDGSYKCARSSTDDPSSLEYEVQLAVYAGSCPGQSCIASTSANDRQWTGRTDDVVWKAELNSYYYLFLNGVEPGLDGDFRLDVVSTPPNVVCEESLETEVGGGVLSGTTRNSCRAMPVNCPNTIESDDVSGVWYVINATGSNLISAAAEFDMETRCTDGRGARAQVSVFSSTSSGCDALECIDYTEFCDPDSKATVSQWLSDPNVEYHIFVQSSEPSDFHLRLSETMLEGPDTCVNAVAISVGGSILGSTAFATGGGLMKCDNSSQFLSSPSVFFTVNGTGGDMTASTCNDGTNYFSGVSILTGTCGTLACFNYTSVACDGVRSLALWPSVLGETYYVVVHGTDAGGDSGRFNLTIEDGGLEVENDFCTTAQSISFPSIANGTTVGARLDESSKCEADKSARQSPGVWYSGMVQEDSVLIASLCNQGTSNFDTVLQVFTGSCSSLSCVATNDDFDNQVCGRRSLVSWNATAGEEYYILVTGYAEFDVGDIQLQLAISDELQLDISN